MNVPIWAADLAVAFWRLAGEPGPFPRNVREAIERGVPLSVVSLPNLNIKAVSRWLEDRKVVFPIRTTDRQLHGLLFTTQGVGFVFIDSTDGEEQQRFTLAHELAHYLRDYWRSRERLRQCLGDAALDVVDGVRAATWEERVIAAVADLQMKSEVHFLERSQDGGPVNSVVQAAEDDADRLALELLAPAAHVATLRLEKHERSLWAPTLQAAFGLPEGAAAKYANLLAPRERCDPLLLLARQALRG